jgi:ATP-dependent Clp protease ATP-binding subunit ClpB
LSQFLFDSEDAMIRMDMSEYSEKHAVAKLIGAPAGYVGYEEGGVLTEAVRRKPYAILLFDEIEKAHPDFADILLQILDDGRLTDNKGRTIRFNNTLVLLTTNSKDIERDFKPEVLGRLDAVLDYRSLDPKIMEQLVAKQLHFLNEKLRSKHIKVRLHPSAMDVLCTRGYDPVYGARPLASLFQRLVTRDLARRILEGNLSEKDIELKWDTQLEKMAY